MFRRSVRAGLRMTGAILLFVVVVKAWGAWRDRGEPAEEPDDAAVERVADDELDIKIAPGDLPGLAGSLFNLRQADDSADVARAAARVLETAKKSGASVTELYDARTDLIELMGDNADSSDIRAVDAAIRSVAGTPPPVPNRDSLLRAYLAATERNDSPVVTAYRDSVKAAFAGAELEQLRKEKMRADLQSDSLARELVTARKARGFRTFLAGAADDLGVGFGWSAVYFTAFLALWRGQTPGKRAARLRVLRLDGKPLGWWISFERFGGYAASFSVGLIGFIQILWDRNRQRLHDKACETVVVYDSPQVRSRS